MPRGARAKGAQILAGRKVFASLGTARVEAVVRYEREVLSTRH
jgi:hypothetical protein